MGCRFFIARSAVDLPCGVHALYLFKFEGGKYVEGVDTVVFDRIPVTGAFVLVLPHIYCTAGVLRRPSASIYLSAALAAIYYLVKLKRYPDEKKEG